MSKSIGESLFEVLIMLNFTAKIHFFVRTAKFLTKKLSEIYILCIFVTKYNKQNFYSLISETSNEPIIQDITIVFAHSCMYTTHHAGYRLGQGLRPQLINFVRSERILIKDVTSISK